MLPELGACSRITDLEGAEGDSRAGYESGSELFTAAVGQICGCIGLLLKILHHVQ